MLPKLRALITIAGLFICMVLKANKYTVSNTNNGGANSLREAINLANQNPGLDTIIFNIAGLAPHTIELNSPLPYLTDATIIDGSYQPANGYNGVSPKIIIDGTSIIPNNINDPEDISGIVILAPQCEIYGLFIKNFIGSAVYVMNNDNYYDGNHYKYAAHGNNFIIGDINEKGNVLSGCHNGIHLLKTENGKIINNKIGTDELGKNALPNYYGIVCYSSNNIVIGKSYQNFRGAADYGLSNLISGNSSDGIGLYNSESIYVSCNYIGTDILANSALSNGQQGISILNSNEIYIGGSIKTANVISGNKGNGINITQNSSNCYIKSNIIGLDKFGKNPIPNNSNGIRLNNSSDIIVGGSLQRKEGNIISGNSMNGIDIERTAGYNNSSINIQSNLIGTDITGSTSLGNKENGIRLIDFEYIQKDEEPLNTVYYTKCIIGGNQKDFKNIISGNGIDGIFIDQVDDLTPNFGDIEINNNYIGTDITGNFPIGNQQNGISVGGFLIEGKSIMIGGVIGSGNIISGNREVGVEYRGNYTGDDVCPRNNAYLYIKNNYIGTNASGSSAISNYECGVRIAGNFQIGSIFADSNLVSSNVKYNIYVNNNPNWVTTRLSANLIGCDITGTKILDPEIIIPGSEFPLISCTPTAIHAEGSYVDIHDNLITGYCKQGIELPNLYYSNILYNKIGVNISGTRKLNNANVEASGVLLQSSSGVTIRGNLVSGHNSSDSDAVGMNIYTSKDITLLENTIGTDIQQANALSNDIGVAIWKSENIIIGNSTNDGNLISGNLQSDILTSQACNKIYVRGNIIGLNKAKNKRLSSSESLNIGLTKHSIIGGNASLNLGNDIAGYIALIESDSNEFYGNRIGLKAISGINDNGPGNKVQIGFTLWSANDNTIGKINAGYRNIIAGAFRSAIEINGSKNHVSSSQNNIRGNIIYCNNAKGIDLINGGNNNYPAPIIKGASLANITGITNSKDSAIIDLYYADDICNTGCQGKEYIGSTIARNGYWQYNGTIKRGTKTIVATATSFEGNTSEFTCSCVIQTSITISPQQKTFCNQKTSDTLITSYILEANNIKDSYFFAGSNSQSRILDKNGNEIPQQTPAYPDINGQVTVRPKFTIRDSDTIYFYAEGINGCRYIAPVIFNNSSLRTDAGQNLIINPGQQVTIGGNPTAWGGKVPYTYKWSPANDLNKCDVANPMASPATTTTFTVKVTDDIGCTSKSIATIRVNNKFLLGDPIVIRQNFSATNPHFILNVLQKISQDNKNISSNLRIGWSVNGIVQKPYIAREVKTTNSSNIEQIINLGTINAEPAQEYKIDVWIINDDYNADGTNNMNNQVTTVYHTPDCIIDLPFIEKLSKVISDENIFGQYFTFPINAKLVNNAKGGSVKSAVVHWQICVTDAVTAQDINCKAEPQPNYIWNGIIPAGSSSDIFDLGNINIEPNKNYAIKVWTTEVINTDGSINTNDEVFYQFSTVTNTNYYSNTLIEGSLNSVSPTNKMLMIYPNPLKSEAIVKAVLTIEEIKTFKNKATISLYEASGKKLATFNMIKNNNALEGKIRKANLSTGNYYFTISDNKQILRRGKVTIE